MAKDFQEELLKELRQRIIDFVRAERLRLSVERSFLQSVLDNSLGGPTKKQDVEDRLQSIDSVTRFLGIKRPTQN